MSTRDLVVLVPLLVACDGPPVPVQPTWADVEPILRGNCTHCHGANSQAGGGVRFDMFAVTADGCGPAALALDAPQMAHGFAPLIAADLAIDGGRRPRMPPAPAAELDDWERETVLRWTSEPVLGAPRDNQPPRLSVFGEQPVVDRELAFTIVVDDPDGEGVVGVLELGPRIVKLDGPGSFRVAIDTTTWQTGRYVARANLCDSWEQVSYELSEIVVVH